MAKTAAELRAEAADLTEASKAADEKARALKAEANRLEREERAAKAKAETDAHSEKMWTDIGRHWLTREQHAIVYGCAYSEGHAHGFSEIETHYYDLAEMGRKLIEASK